MTESTTNEKHEAVLTALKRGCGGYPYVPHDEGATVRDKFNRTFGTDIQNGKWNVVIGLMYDQLRHLGHIA